MKLKTVLIAACLQVLMMPIGAKPDSSILSGGNPSNDKHIVVNNRILAQINGKPISAIDVMKKMDILFYRQYPEYAKITDARFQFYQVNWQHFLQELIDKELVLADAEEGKLPITNGDVRQEMETLFGPNIMSSLDKVGLTYDEAWNIVKGDIILRRMLYIRVNSKAMKRITPQLVKSAYEQYIHDNVKPDTIKYHVISVRDKNSTSGAEAANFIYEILKEGVPPSQISEKFAEAKFKVSTKVSVSEELKNIESELSDSYKEALMSLNNGSFSHPMAQKSRADRTTVYRIFYLTEKEKGRVETFKEIESKLTEKLIEAEVSKETAAYLTKLRKHFAVYDVHLKQMANADFQPYTLH